jgi:hypothetical protein
VPGPVRPASTAAPLTAASDASSHYGTVQGQTGKEAILVRVRFRDRPGLLDLAVVQSWAGYEVNFYVGLFPHDWTPVEVTAYDAAGRRLAACALPRCPGG